jgi:hypothetical protein
MIIFSGAFEGDSDGSANTFPKKPLITKMSVATIQLRLRILFAPAIRGV